MSEMVDRVSASIMTAAMPKNFGAIWIEQPENVKDNWRVLARAAMGAMREPTESMLRIGLAAFDWSDERSAARNIWPDMIDEALNEKEAA